METFDFALQFIELHGWFGVMVIISLGLFLLTIRIACEFAPVWIKKSNLKREHKVIKERQKVDVLMREKLCKLLLNTKADRAMIIEFHNGKENLSGLPFRYGSCSYEMTREDDDTRLSGMFKEMNLSNYDIPPYLLKEKLFVGSMNDFKKIDNVFFKPLIKNGSKYVCLLLLKNLETNLGILVLSYDNDEGISRSKIVAVLSQYVQELSQLLTLKQ
jgi:hypothetical protein